MSAKVGVGLRDRIMAVAPELTRNLAVHSSTDLSTSSAEPLPSWDYSFDILDGFEQYMDTTPNVPAASFAAQGFSPVINDVEQPKEDPSEVNLQQLTSCERRQHKNKLAQKRFRERQKASRHYQLPRPEESLLFLLCVSN